MAFSLDTSPIGYVVNSCVQFYAAEELKRANGILWDVADNHIIGDYTNRRDGSTRSLVEVLHVASDIVGAIQKLVDPIGIHRIPKAIPSVTNTLSMCERLNTLESKMKMME